MFNFHLGPYARFNIGTRLSTDTQHLLTAANRGDPTNSGASDKVEANSVDVNPDRRDVIDNSGRRYAIDDVLTIQGFANLIMTF